MKKRILFLSWRDIKAPKAGGAEVYTHEMLKRSNQVDYEFIYFSPKFEGCESEEIIDGIRYVRGGEGPFSVILEAKKYYNHHKEYIHYVVDQCNTHRFFTKFWVEKEKRIFFIHQLTREIWDYNLKFPFNVIGRKAENFLLKLSKNDPTITVSQSTKDDLVSVGFNKDKITILPEGIDFKPWTWQQFYPKSKDPIFIYVGRFSNYKGIDKVIQSFIKFKSRYYRSQLWIVGKKDQDYIDNVIDKIIKNEAADPIQTTIDITYFGYVSQEEKLKLMSQAHALIFPSTREGWGLVITEAAAVGTPSIGFNSPGIRDALKYGEAGYLCKKNTIDEIYENMTRVYENKDEYREIRKNAYEFALNFHWDNTAKEFNKFLDSLNGGKDEKDCNCAVNLQ